MRCAAFLTSLLLVSLACGGAAEEHLEEDSSVSMTASGGIHRSSLMRKHAHQEDAEEQEEQHHDHKHKQHHKRGAAATKAMFDALDLNEDGVVDYSEVRATAEKTNSKTPKSMLKMLSDIDTNGDGAISYKEFTRAAAKEAVHHRAPVHEHRPASELEREEDDVDEDPVVPFVTCGGHKAATCSACTTTNAQGNIVFDHGAEWCNGDCVYHESQCHTKGTVTVDGTLHTSQGHSTSPVPDLLNPELTENDETIIDDAAKDAVTEENKEKDLKEKEEQEAVADEKFNMGKFWLIVIISFSVILGLCALVSCVALIVFCMMPKPELPPTKEELLDEQNEDYGEGEEAVGEAQES